MKREDEIRLMMCAVWGAPPPGQQWFVEVRFSSVHIRGPGSLWIEINTGNAHTALDQTEYMLKGMIDRRYVEVPCTDEIDWLDFPGASAGFHRVTRTTFDIWQNGRSFEATVAKQFVRGSNGKHKRWLSLESAKAGAEKHFRDSLRAKSETRTVQR